jgi:diaminopimelate decarboxylase
LKALPIARKRIFFATMANDHPSILACVRECGLGVFVNSPTHLRLVREIGFDPARIVYAASNMLPEEMIACVRQNVNLVLDSIGQIQTLAEMITSPVEIGVRVNVGSALDRLDIRHDPLYRFGLLPDELTVALEIARRGGIKIVGVHSYFGTGLMQPEILLNGLNRLAEQAEVLPDLRYLDTGGGFGVPDTLDGSEFDLKGYGEGAARIMHRFAEQLGREIELYIEPGRYLAADSGYFFVKVVDCKVREDRVFIGTNGSVACFPRPLLYPEQARHPCELIGERGRMPSHPHPAYVCGNSTYSQDFLARNIVLPLPEPGDSLVFYYAGAYGRSMVTRFLGKDHPEEIIVETAKIEALAAEAKGAA